MRKVVLILVTVIAIYSCRQRPTYGDPVQRPSIVLKDLRAFSFLSTKAPDVG